MPWWTHTFHRKGNLERMELALLLLVGLVPLLLIVIRITALPGVLSPGVQTAVPDFIRAFGRELNQFLSLGTASAVDRDRIIYLLFMPTYAMLIVLARQTLGLRVLGFRSILIAIGFQASGIVPSLMLIAVVVATIAAVRPLLKKIRLPYYARVSVILCIVVLTMVAALLVAPWLRSESLWSVAFFPVIVLGLLAEGIARTLDRDSVLNASWRAGMTIVVAFLIALVSYVQLLRELLLYFPEILLTQIVAIVLISEFLDLRLLQDWDAKLTGVAPPRLFGTSSAFRVAVVRNLRGSGVIGRLGRPSPQKHGARSVRRIARGLREGGHTVRVYEADVNLLSALRDFVAPHPRTGEPGGLVFNLASGIQGDAPHAHVPAMLEMAGVPYTGATLLGHALAHDKVASRMLLRQARVPTPEIRVMSGAADTPRRLRYPAVVKPRREATYPLRIARNRSQLEDAVASVVRQYGQEAVVEPYVDGREIHVALLGNDALECLPLVELERKTSAKVCPAPIDAALADRIRACARAAFHASGARDFARVVVRVDESGDPWVIEVDAIGILKRDKTFMIAAERAGYGWSGLVCRIVEIARARYTPRRLASRSEARQETSVPSAAIGTLRALGLRRPISARPGGAAR